MELSRTNGGYMMVQEACLFPYSQGRVLAVYPGDVFYKKGCCYISFVLRLPSVCTLFLVLDCGFSVEFLRIPIYFEYTNLLLHVYMRDEMDGGRNMGNR